MPQLQPLPATAGHPQRLQGCGYALQHHSARHDDASHDDMLGTVANQRPLPDEECEAEVAVPEILRSKAPRNVNVRHDGRFYQQEFHGVFPARLLFSEAQEGRKTRSGTVHNGALGQHHEISPTGNVLGFRTVNGAATDPRISVASARKGLAQITYQGSRHGIRQDQSTDNASFIGMVHPGYQPQISIDGFDINASGEAVEDNHRFYQRNRFVIRHRASQVGK